MTARVLESQVFHFSFPAQDTLVQVEEIGEQVVIRASRDTFTESRRQGFIRELAAEGFISDRHQWPGVGTADGGRGVRWLVDPTCFLPGPAPAALTRRFMLRLLGGASLLWLVMIGLLFAGAAG
ncbi:MAG TPA: hypothetical protein VLW52_01835 [Opitutaceae bacterium]|nr:hypothetical protein [Opitutaceae bacterium]HUJ42325.1 hypothetical protein [Opitutaceae bacterium]